MKEQRCITNLGGFCMWGLLFLITSSNTLNPTAAHTSWISVDVGFSTAC